jgi:hypothetical protein
MREERVITVVGESEKAAVRAAADKSGLNVSAYVRHVLRADAERLGCWPIPQGQPSQVLQEAHA